MITVQALSRTRLAFCLVIGTLLALSFGPAAHATTYGSGYYGRCQYESCSISMSSSSNVSINVVPAGSSQTCTVASDTVTVTTDSSTGYNVTLADSDTSTNLVNGSNNITATTGTFASPTTMGNNTWGYRVDGAGGFGSGPTTAVTNGSVPTLAFAGVQPSNGTADQIVNSSTAASSGASTSVWYGLCINTSKVNGTYSDSVLYTAVIN